MKQCIKCYLYKDDNKFSFDEIRCDDCVTEMFPEYKGKSNAIGQWLSNITDKIVNKCKRLNDR